jgi:hypothetical protein
MRFVRLVPSGLLAAFVLTFVLAAFAAPRAFACSCVQTTIGGLDPTQNQVYVATAGQPTPQGMPMAVERWFAGPGAAPVVILGPASFGDSASCGTEAFPAGSRWIVSTWAGDPTQPPTTGLCQPHALLESPEGQAMLTEAVTAYGDGSAPEGGGAGPTATPVPTAPSAPTDPSTVVILAGVIGLAVIGLGLVYVLGRGRQKAG